VRWATVGAEQVAAAVRALYREQSRLGAAALRAVKAVDDRDDVVPIARPGTAAASFLQHSVGLERRQALLEAEAARLLDGHTGDLPAVGDAYAAGETSRAHVEVCARVHRRLSATVREGFMPVVDPVTAEQRDARCIEVADSTLAAQARVLGVAEFRHVADRLIEYLNPPGPDDAHQRRYLHLNVLADGSLLGRFACGPAQALALTTAIEAGAALRPGTGLDEHGIEHQIPDERSAGARRMDALIDALHAGHASGITGAATPDDPDHSATTYQQTGQPGDLDESMEPCPPARDTKEPEPEGQYQVRRAPGIRTGPYPTVEIIVTATLNQLATAISFSEPRTAAPEHDPPGGTRDPRSSGPPLSPSLTEGFARGQYGQPVHPRTLALLACSARLRRVLLDRHGAALDLGRGYRLATSAQRRALLARDGGCAIPGCAVPGGPCDVHHPVAWADGGSTNLDNLVMLCPRHHSEIHDGDGWQIEMLQGIPWVRPPAWVDPTRPLLRNTTHRPTGTAA
jgi:Domain of unknown function (DUF222)/HNH endonuclease